MQREAAIKEAEQASDKRLTALPFVSIVIPVRNDAKRLAVCLRSLLAQNYPPDRFEVIVVDNGSADDTCAVAERYSAKVLSYPGLRVGALRNRGVSAALGTILAFIDSDHEAPTGWLQSGTEQLLQCDDLSMVGSGCLAPVNGTWVQTIWALHRLRNNQRRNVDWLGAGNLFVRRVDFEGVHGFHEELVAAEDVDLCARLAANGGKIVSDMRTANVHHGEPRSLWEFFRKEYWRGSSGFKAFFAHGMPSNELPSLIFPIYTLFALTLTIAAMLGAIAGYNYWYAAIAFLLLALPPLLLAIRTAIQVRRALSFPPLAILFFAYGLARMASLFKS